MKPLADPLIIRGSLICKLLCCVILAAMGCDSSPQPATPPQESVQISVTEKPLEQNDNDKSTLVDSTGTKSADIPQPEQPAVIPMTRPEPVPSEPAQQFSEEELQELGISLFSSKTLRLLVDHVRPQEQAELQRIPRMLDQFVLWLQQTYPGLQIQSGPEFQLTGYLMRNRDLYLKAGLLPEELADIEHGMERGREFWLSEQPTTYYREHLLLHEATHCLMNQQPHEWPVWFLEGTAELFAGHRWKSPEEAEFGVFPGQEQIRAGFGRIQLLQTERERDHFRRIDQVLELNFSNFYPHRNSYAWSWAFCSFLARHPETAAKFPELLAARQESEFNFILSQTVPGDQPRFDIEWAAFIENIVPDYDFQRSAIQWENTRPESTPVSPLAPAQATLQANKSWQSTGILLEAGKRYHITGQGSYQLGYGEEIWECEPQGVSIDYFAGQPAGILQMVLYTPDQHSKTNDFGFLDAINLGKETQFTAPAAGELFFRINDLASDWANNSGQVQIEVQQQSNQ